MAGNSAVSDPGREAGLDEADVKLLLLSWWASTGCLAVSSGDNGDWASWCLGYGATSAVISADIKNFESTLSKMIKGKQNKQSSRKLLLASQQAWYSLFFYYHNDTQWFNYSNKVTDAISSPNQSTEADIAFWLLSFHI